MRSMFLFAAALAALLPASACLADDYDDCKTQCAADRDSRNANCPSPYDTSQEERDQCLKDSQDAYLACVHACPPPASSQGPSTMTYAPDGSATPAAATTKPDQQPRDARPPAT